MKTGLALPRLSRASTAVMSMHLSRFEMSFANYSLQ